MKESIAERIFELLSSSSKVVWWLDSGSLLGIIRNGKLLEQDTDIDIGIKLQNNNLQTIERIVFEISKIGFRIVKLSWNEHIYKYKLIPNNNLDFEYKLDISLFKQANDEYICPQGIKHTNQSGLKRIRQKLIDWKKGNTISKGNSIRSHIVYNCYKFYSIILLQKTQEIRMDTLVPNYYSIYKWVIPAEYINNIYKYNNNLNIPNNVSKYLEYRYGNWKVPTKDWNFTVDDNGLFPSSPDEMNKIYLNNSRGKM